ncbi:hypothetical protein [Arthrobacter sp. AD-310]
MYSNQADDGGTAAGAALPAVAGPGQQAEHPGGVAQVLRMPFSEV